MASLTLRPGARVRLKGQDDHVPDFYVVSCDYDRCWIRQSNWNPGATMDVCFTQLFIPGNPAIAAGVVALPPLAAVPSPASLAVAEGSAQSQGELSPLSHKGPLPDNVIDLVAYRLRKASQPKPC